MFLFLLFSEDSCLEDFNVNRLGEVEFFIPDPLSWKRKLGNKCEGEYLVMRAMSCLMIASLIAVPLAGCASSSREISAAYVSPIIYQSYSCQQLAGEMQRISARVQQVSGAVDGRANSDAAMVGVGILITPLFWFLIKGDGAEAQELARLKGEYDAVNQAAIRQNCGMTAGAPYGNAPTSPNGVAAPAGQ